MTAWTALLPSGARSARRIDRAPTRILNPQGDAGMRRQCGCMTGVNCGHRSFPLPGRAVASECCRRRAPAAAVRLRANCLASLALAVFLLLAVAPNAQENSQPSSWNAGDTNAVLEQWTAAAHAGDSRAMLALGRLHRIGLGAPRDPVQALKWLRLAADHGEGSAAAEIDALLGIMTPEERAEGERLAREMLSPAGRDTGSAATPTGSANVQAAVPPPRAAILESQVLLGELGYASGPANGVWNSRTAEAYGAFLRDAGLPLTDVLTPEGLLALRSTAGRQGTGPASAAAPTADSVAQDPPRAAVREAQELLAVLGYAPGAADGAWNSRTAEAYGAFLRDAGLPLTDVLTPEGLLSLRSNAGRRGTGPASAAAPTADSVAQDPPRAAVREAQELLAVLGYAPGPADGAWNSRTAEAYGAFLRDASLPLADVLTPEGLLSLRSNAGRRGTGPASAAAPTADSVARDPPRAAVREAQELLAVLGYAPGPTDGAWNSRTAEAYGAFLRDASLPLADVLTPEGLLALRSTAGRQGTGPASAAAPTADSVAQDPPRAAVREAQELLAVLGYAPGPADGVWGRRSSKAYAAFLEDAGLPAGNALTPEGFLALRSAAGREEDDPEPASIALRPPRAAVLEAQELLALLGYEPGPADGAWGRRSNRAYAEFLRDVNLPPADALTPDGLLALRSAAGGIEEESGLGTAPSATSIGQAPPRAAIREAQRLLAVLGYDPGPADGIWGERTARALAGFLRDAGRPAENLVTAESLLAMRSTVQRNGAATEAGTVPPSPLRPPVFSREAVREAQGLLAALGYAPGPADGIWGRRSARALAAFLRDEGLPAKDLLTPESLLAMRSAVQRTGPATEAGAIPPSPPGPPVSSPEAVREAQELLAALGYAPGPADGIWGRRSARAYAAFLRAVGMPPSDTLTEEGLRTLRVQSGASGAAAHPPTWNVPETRPHPDALHLATAADDAGALASGLTPGE